MAFTGPTDASGRRQIALVDSRALRDVQRDRCSWRPGVEQGHGLRAVDADGDSDGCVATAFPRMQGRRDDRGLAGPVGEVGVVALALRKAQPHRTVRQVVFGIRQRQEIAPQDPHDAGTQLVAAHDELDVLQLGPEQPHPLHDRALGLDRARVALDGHADRQAEQRKLQLRRGRRTQHAVEGAAVQQQGRLGSVQRQRRDRTRVDDLDRDLQLGQLATGARRAHRQRGQHQSRRDPTPPGS
jgi:hypothetical protein